MKSRIVAALLVGLSLGFGGAFYFLKESLKSQTKNESRNTSTTLLGSDYRLVEYRLQKELERSFASLSGQWVSAESAEEIELDLDYRILTIKGKKWPEVNGVSVLLGMPQADFIYSRNEYQIVYQWDNMANQISDVAIMRTRPLDSNNIEEIKLERK